MVTVHSGIHWYDVIVLIAALVLLVAVIWGITAVIRRRTR